MKIFLSACIGIVALSLGACSKGDEAPPPSPKAKEITVDQMKMKFHNGGRGTSSATTPAPGSPPPKAKALTGDQMRMGFHGGGGGRTATSASASASLGSPTLRALKKTYLEQSKTKNIGEAFDTYQHAIKKEWRETTTETGPYYIDYICWFNPSAAVRKEGGTKQGLDVKFAIQKTGEAYVAMASRIDVKGDGKVQNTPLTPDDVKKAITALYENREIVFY